MLKDYVKNCGKQQLASLCAEIFCLANHSLTHPVLVLNLCNQCAVSVRMLKELTP